LRALLCSDTSLDGELAGTMLYRDNVERHQARTAEEAKAAARKGKPDIVLVDRDLPGAAALVKDLREGPETRRISVVALARGDFASSELTLLEAGVNAVLRLPPTGDWDDRLFRLMHIPVRREVRVPVSLQLDLGLGATGEAFRAQAVNISVTGMLIDSEHPLRVGDDLTFAFSLPNGAGEVQGNVTVVRHATAATHYGVELTHVKGDGRVKIKRWVEGL
jgi:CheY-like chemotaxis protein